MAGASARTTRFSVRKDNQFGEGNNFSANPQGALDNFDLEREFGYSLVDTPHRVNISGTLDLPFGEGKRWLSRAGPVRRDPGRMGGQRRRRVSKRLPDRCRSSLPIRPSRSASGSGRTSSRRSILDGPGVRRTTTMRPAAASDGWILPRGARRRHSRSAMRHERTPGPERP